MATSILEELIKQFRAERDMITSLHMTEIRRLRHLQWQHDCNRIHEAFTNVGWKDFANYFKAELQ